MGGFFREIFPFGKKKDEGPKPITRIPSPGAGTGAATTTTRHPVEAPADKPAPVVLDPSVPVNPPPPPVTLSDKPDRFWVDGEEVDSKVIDHPGDPEQGIPPGKQVVKTVLTPIHTKKGGRGTLKIVVTAEPLEDPADREELRLQLSRPDTPADELGAVKVDIAAWPTTYPVIFMATPRFKLIGEGIQAGEESSNAQYRALKLYFYGDEPMRAEIEIDWNITQGDIPAWAWPAFRFSFHAIRAAHEQEVGDKEVRIA